MATKGGPEIITDGLLMYLDASNPNSISDAGYEWIDLSKSGIVTNSLLNLTSPAAWNAICFSTFDQNTSNSVHFVNANNGDTCSNNSYLGFTLNGKYVFNYTVWYVKCDLIVYSGNTRLHMGSAGGGYTEGLYTNYTGGTYVIDRYFHVGDYYLTHEANPLQFCVISTIEDSEATVTNLEVYESGNDAVLRPDNGASFQNGYVHLDGSDDFVGTSFRTSDFFSENDPFSLSIWVKINQTISARGGLICNQKYQTESEPGGFGLSIESDGTTELILTHSGSTSATTYQDLAPITLSEDVWQNIVYTYDPTSNTVYGYKDGTQANSTTNASLNWSTYARNTLIGKNTQGGWGNFIAMDINDVRIYDRCITADEVLINYRSVKSKYMS